MHKEITNEYAFSIIGNPEPFRQYAHVGRGLWQNAMNDFGSLSWDWIDNTCNQEFYLIYQSQNQHVALKLEPLAEYPQWYRLTEEEKANVEAHKNHALIEKLGIDMKDIYYLVKVITEPRERPSYIVLYKKP